MFHQVSSHPDLRSSDKDDNCILFCYDECNNSTQDLIKRSRGVVFDKDTKEVVSDILSYTEEYNTLDDPEEEIKKYFNTPGVKFYESYEGAIVRVFYYKDKWYITTHRKLNAFNSFWASKKSFGEMFTEALASNDGPSLESFLSTLNRNYQYNFLVGSTPDNYLVCSYNDLKVWHVGTYVKNDDGKLVEVDKDCMIRKHKELFFKTYDELLQYVDNVDPTQTQGVIMFLPDNRQVKIFNDRYQRLFNVRGNEASIKFRYLQLRQAEDEKSILLLKELYPHFIKDFEEYEAELELISLDLFNKYNTRYVNKVFNRLLLEEHIVVEKAKLNKQPVTQDDIKVIMLTMEPSAINKILRTRKEAKLKLEREQNKAK